MVCRCSSEQVFLKIWQCFQENTCVGVSEHTWWLLLELSWTLSSLHLKTMNGVTSGYVLAFQFLFHFIACVSFFSISFSFFIFSLWIRLLAEILRKICQYLGYSSGVVPRFPSGVSRGTLLQPYLAFNVTGVVQYGKNFRYVLPPLAS